MMRSITTLGLLFLLLNAHPGHAENWPQFRGPFFNGSTTEKGLPETWSTTENVAWSADLPGGSAATPIIWGDHVFVSTIDLANDTLCAIAYDRKTGKQWWKHDIAKGVRQDSRSNYASPSPATDGSVVVFFYGQGSLVAYNFAGQEQWSRDLQEEYGEFAFQWTFSTSPVLHDGRLFMQVLQRDVPARGRGQADQVNESYLLAIDPKTGETIYRHVRPSQAVQESRESFATPLPIQFDGRDELVVIGGDDITGHDPGTGKELWRWGTWNPDRIPHWRHVPSPVIGDNILLVCAPKGDPIYAVKAGGNGQLGDQSIAWISSNEKSISSDVPTPAFYDGDFFILNEARKVISRVKPSSGEIVWSARTPGTDKFEASPLVADGKIYLVNFNSNVVVMDAQDGTILHQVTMDDPNDEACRSSIVASQGQLFIQTPTKLFCIGK
jgi:outer membrane protein assembly factor BamB